MIFVLNNKSNFKLDEFYEYKSKLLNSKYNDLIILCPSFCYLPLCNDLNISIGAQDVSQSDSLSFTGEITAKQLKSLNVSYCIVGHADRKETNKIIKGKVKMLLDNDIVPILCFGEEKKVNDLEKLKEILVNKIKCVIGDLKREEISKIILAYEPVWAINSCGDFNIDNIKEILKWLKDNFMDNKLIYGGGINLNNYKYISELKELDGLLLGRFGNDIDSLIKIFR